MNKIASHRSKIDKLKILQWNIQGLRSKHKELCSILASETVNIACLQETLLEDNPYKENRNYHTEKSPHIAGDRNRGVAVLIHKTLPYSRINITTILEAVEVTVRGRRSYSICSI